MSDEEKKAIERAKFLNNIDTYLEKEMLTNLLKLIEKQSKEIEELKKPKYIIDCKTNEITTLTNDFVSKDKIKAKIEWLDKEGYVEFLSNRDILKCHNILASLLEKE